MRQCEKVLYSGTGHRRKYDACASHAGYLGKVKVALRGLFSTAAFKTDCTLAPEIVPSFISRGAPRETSTNEGRKLNTRILLATRNLPQLLGSFTCPKVGTCGRLTSPPKESMLRSFTSEKSNGFGRV
jgi:hypothetical protein